MSTSSPLRVWRTLLTAAGLAVAAAFVLPACGADRPGVDADAMRMASDGGGGSTASCLTPQESCACTEPGKVVECGAVSTRSGDQVICSMGTRTCLGDRWGACEGTNKIVSRLNVTIGAGNVGGLALGASQPCGAINPCDPYCNVFVDDPIGIPLPPGVVIGPGGITVPGTSQAIACKVPTDPIAAYAALPAALRANGGPPTTCAAATNNCSSDTKCSAGACATRAVGESATCSGPDFTLGAGCWDGTRFNYQVCNRGTVGAVTGSLRIAHFTGTPNVAPSTCGIATAGAAGDCTIDLAAKPLNPGQCVSFIPTIDCPLSVASEAGNHFYYVNRSNTGAALVAGECNTCNNYTATSATTQAVAATACSTVSCGGSTTTTGQPATSSTPNGINTCAGSQDEITEPCSGDPYRNCQQDFHCDTATNRCVWNESTLFKDTSCTGVDLTLGVGCETGGSPNQYRIPVCNRGTVALPAGKVIKAAQGNTGAFNSWDSNCATGGGSLTPFCSTTLTAALQPGQCLNMICPVSNGQRWEVVNYDNSVAECGAPGGGCKNNGSQVKSNGAGCQNCQCLSGTAELTGLIKDPGKLRPVYGVTVYVPSTGVGVTAGALDGPNVRCDTCANAFKGLPAKASVTTDVDGTFRLQGVPAGVSFPLVIQLGRFRRQITIPAIPPCGTLNLDSIKAHLPGTTALTGDYATDAVAPDLPLIAMVTGHGDALECLLLKMGISASEFTSPAAATPGRVQMYTYKREDGLTGTIPSPSSPQTANDSPSGQGLTFSGGQVGTCNTTACQTARLNSVGNAHDLFGTAATLDKYNTVILPCGDANLAPDTTMQTNFRSWLDAGGRVFASHHQVEDFIRNPNNATNDYKDVASWSFAGTPAGGTTGWAKAGSPDQADRAGATPSTPAGGATLRDTINVGTPSGAALATWLQNTGATTTLGQISLPNYRHDVTTVNAAQSINWFSGTSTFTGTGSGPQVNMMSFDAPVGVPAANQCGRAVLPFMHVSTGVANPVSNTFATNPVPVFPAACGSYPGALTSQEAAFEFMMWESMRCLAPASATPFAPQPSPPPAPVPLVTATLTRDYAGVCPTGTRLQWGFFQWRSVTPSGTSVTFRAATAADAASLPTSSTAASTVPIGTASGAAITAPSWGQDAQTVDWHLANDPPDPAQDSGPALRVFMTLNVGGLAAPALVEWRQLYDCIPAE